MTEINYIVFQQAGSVIMTLGGVQAENDQEALIKMVNLVRSKMEDPGLELDHRISIQRPDGTEVCAPATVAEFIRK